MSQIPASLFFRQGGFSVGAIPMDLILDESHNLSSTVTQRRIENGSVLTDHIQNNPFTGSFTGLVTNHSLKQETATNRAISTWGLLESLHKKRELVTIVTVLKVYENVAISNIGAARSEADGSSQSFTIDFLQVEVKDLQELELETTFNVKDMDTNLKRQSSRKVNAGRQVAKTVSTGGGTSGTALFQAPLLM